MNYCSNCGSDQLAFVVPNGDNRPRFVCGNCNTIHYSNPNIVAGCLPVWDNKVLLCRRAIEPRLGYWNIPSGFLENGESVEEGAIREVWEEALAKVEVQHILSIYSLPHINQVYIHLLGDLVSGQFGVGEESLESQLFAEEDIPWEEMAFTSSVFSLKRYFKDRRAGNTQSHLGVFRLPSL